MAIIDGTMLADIIKPGNNSAGNSNLNGRDTINGLAGDDDIDGGRGNDIINGGDDNDTLVGGAGRDIVSGGDGDDILNGVDNRRPDILDGGEGFDFVDYRNATTGQIIFFDPAGNSRGERSADTWISIEGVMGALNQRNIIVGAGNDDRIIGGNRNDRLFGRDGADTLEGQGGRDRLNGGDGFDILNGGRGSDSLTGGDDLDVFYFEEGEINGRDRIEDFVLGTDFIFLEKTGVTLEQVTQIIARNAIGDPNGDVVYVDPTEGGSITLRGVSNNEFASYLNNGGDLQSIFYLGSFPTEDPVATIVTTGGRRRDNLEGGDDIDFLFGGNGRDRLDGGAERDFLDGGRGRDTLTGGEEADRFLFGRNDTITDFSIAEGDKILFDARFRLDFDDLSFRQFGSDTIVSVGRARMRLEDFTDTLTEDNFNFGYVRGETDIELL